MFPIAGDLEGSGSPEGNNNDKPYLEADRYLWLTQLFYDQELGTDFRLFLQFAPWINIDRQWDFDQSYVATPLSAFLSFFPNRLTTLYLMNEIWPTYGTMFISSYFNQSGLGAKYQLIPGKLELELLYTRFIVGKNSGAGETYNFGIRIIN